MAHHDIDRMKRLEEALEVCIRVGNTFMAENIRRTMREEAKKSQR